MELAEPLQQGEIHHSGVEMRVLLLAPTTRDAAICQDLLSHPDLEIVPCVDVADVCRQLAAGATVLVTTEMRLAGDHLEQLAAVLDAQPSWSDLPVLLLASGGAESSLARRAAGRLRNVLLLSRPVQLATFVSAVRMSVRARMRQYQVRDQMQATASQAAALRQSEARFRALMNALPVGVSFSDDATCQRITGNPAMLAQFDGRPQDNLSASALHPEERGRQFRYYAEGRLLADSDLPLQRAVAENRDIPPMELEVQLPSGRRWFASASGAPIRDEQGNVIGGVAVTVDITTRKQAEAQLRESEEKFRTLADNMSQFAWMADERGWIFWYNQRWYDYTGTTLEQMQGWGWQKVHHPEHVDRVVAKLRRHFERGAEWEDTFPLRGKDGRYRWFLSRAIPIRDAAGRILRWFGTNTDVTVLREAGQALRESEERFRAMADNLPLIVWLRDADCRLEFVNRTFREFFGVTQEEIRAGAWHKPIHPDDQQCYFDELTAAAREQRPFHAECRVRRMDGEWRWIESYGQPRFAPAGEFLGFVGASPDITERKELEQHRAALLDSERQARSAAERAARAKDEFLATLSHELRTPLAAILGWSQMLRRGRLSSEDADEAVKVIEDNARLQKQLIEDLLDMSRIVSGKMKLDSQPLEIAALTEAAVAMFRPAAEEKGVRLELKLDACAGQVLGDAGRLKQVIGNLLSNAVKFTPAGGRIRVVLRRKADQAVIAIKDTGIGMSAEFVPQLFERFRQADASSTRKFRGLGLGLALVKQITELHQGTVRARSRGEGRGSTFIVELPLISTARPQARAQEITEQLACDVDLSGVRTLVLDDEPSTRGLVARVLREAGAEVFESGSAADAWEELQARSFAVLICDISMPGEDGYSLMRRIRRLPDRERAEIPAIALTAFSRSDDRRRSFEAGYQTHLTKPVEPAELCAVVLNLARRPDPVLRVGEQG